MNEVDYQDYLNFLTELLQATESSNGDAEVVYPLLANNLDKINLVLADLLQRWVTDKFAELAPDAAQSIAADVVNFGNLIGSFPLGEKACNLEIAIACYNQALKQYNRYRSPDEWAMVQNHLGNAYRNRIAGNKSDNLEIAIAYYTQALEERTCDHSPYECDTSVIALIIKTTAQKFIYR